ncbi:MAG: sulfite exporter TauE/SafE family protein [Flavobacteriales bacterium]
MSSKTGLDLPSVMMILVLGCGPLIVALEMTSGKSLWMRSRWIYHAGRTASYALMGAQFGWIGSCASAGRIWESRSSVLWLTQRNQAAVVTNIKS